MVRHWILTRVTVVCRRGKVHTKYLILDKSLRHEIVHYRWNHCIRVGRERSLCEVDGPNTDDPIDTFEIGIRKCIADGLIVDDEIRCEGHLIEICLLSMIKFGTDYEVLTLQSREVARPISNIHILPCGDTGGRLNIWNASTATKIKYRYDLNSSPILTHRKCWRSRCQQRGYSMWEGCRYRRLLCTGRMLGLLPAQ